MSKASDNVKKLQKDLVDLKNQLSSFKDIKLDNFNAASKDVKSLNTDIAAANALLKDLKPDLDYISSSFKDSINSLQKTNYFIELQKKGLKGVASQADMISSIKQGELDTDAKSIKKQQEKYKVNLKNLEAARDSGEIFGKDLIALKKQIREAKIVQTGFEGVLKVNKDINKQLGAGPALAGGIDKALQKIGMPSLGINDAVAETQALGQAAKAAGKEFKAMPAFLGKIGSSIKGAFTKANILQGGIALITKGLLDADKATEDLARGLGMSMDAAHEMRGDFADIANSSGNINITTKAVQESQMAMGKSLGTRAALNAEDLETMTNMVKTMGFQHDELVGLEKLSLSQGKSLKSNTNEILGGARAYASRNKLVVNEKEILKEVSNASASLKLSLGGSAQAVAEAAVQAKKFGINLEQAEKIAGSLLDFESSIESELSAELLTGKDLNLEKARGLALAGKSTEAAAAMLEQVGSAAEFGEMNVLQQQDLAKAMGMQKDELAASLIESEALAAMSAKEGESALQAYDRLKASGKTEKEIVKILGEKAAKNLEAQSNQSKFNAMVEKLKDIFIQVGDALMPVFDIFGDIFNIVGPIVGYIGKMVSFIKPLVGPVLLIYGAFKGMELVTKGMVIAQEALVALKGGELVANNAILSSLTFQDAILVYKMAKEEGITGFKALQVAAEETILGSIIAQGFGIVKNLVKGGLRLAQSMAIAAAELMGVSAMTLGIGTAVAVAAAVAGYAVLSSMKDGVIGPGGETIVSGPKGSIQVDKEDSMIVGTDLGGKKKPKKPSGDSGGSVNIDLGPTNALLQQLISVVNAGGSINIDGQKVGEALKLGTYKTQ